MKIIFVSILLSMLVGCMQLKPDPLQTPAGIFLIDSIIMQQGKTAGASKK